MSNRHKRYGKEFNDWAIKFYNSKRWKDLRNNIRRENRMRCNHCNKLIRGKSIVDHIEEITPDNKDDIDITLNADNLQLLCLECHNSKTFGTPMDFEPTNKRNVNLF